MFGRSYNPCRCCEVTERQLNIVNEEKRELMNTILDLVKPAPTQNQIPFVTGMQQIPQVVRSPSARWDVRLREKERQARELKSTTEILKHDRPEIRSEVEKLEAELGINEDAKQDQVKQTV